MLKNKAMLEDHELMEREPDLQRLRFAYDLLKADQSTAIIELEKLTEDGSVMSELYLADFYSRKPNTDPLNAEKWFKVAFDHGSARGLVCLAIHYAKAGKLDEAERLYLIGKSRNDGPSMYYLAKLYIRENRHAIASGEIKNLLEGAAAQGHASAMRDLWQMHVKGIFGMQNIPKGIWLLIYYLYKSFSFAFLRRADGYGPSDRRLW